MRTLLAVRVAMVLDLVCLMLAYVVEAESRSIVD
jgi:hypothetical protein